MQKLERGMDFRKPEYRREVFLRFYEFHLRYRSHPCGMYQFIPYLSKQLNWNLEQRLWYATITAVSAHPMTSFLIFETFPNPEAVLTKNFENWFQMNWKRLPFDLDRRRLKKGAPQTLEAYAREVQSAGSQEKFYTGAFTTLWERVQTLPYVGRFVAWGWLEVVKIASNGKFTFEFDSLMLRDIDGSKSHRNGLCIVLGRDDLDWNKHNLQVSYDSKTLSWLEDEGAKLLAEACTRFAKQDFREHACYETLESTLCCYKSWHRLNRRYPNVYNDMNYLRLKDIEAKNPDLDSTLFWKAREQYLPPKLRVECTPDDPGMVPAKQNLYLRTGQVPMMDLDWPCFENDGSWKRRSLLF